MTNDEQGRLRLRRRSALRAYLELIRLPNVFTAMADVAMGFFFVQEIARPRDAAVWGLLLLASSLLYAAGVVLNDVFDLPLDVRQRPERPLPSGRISRAAAAWLGWELLLFGAAVTWLVASLVGHFRPGMVVVWLAACIVLYDAWLKRTPVGPLAMGACRMFNVLLGMSVTSEPWLVGPRLAGPWLVALGVGTYIAGVTWFARTESRESSRVHLGLATTVMMLGIALLAWFGGSSGHLGQMRLRRYRTLMVILGALIGWRCLRVVIEPIPARVQMAVKQGILSLVVLDAAVCYAATGSMWWAATILLLLVPAMFLGRWIHST